MHKQESSTTIRQTLVHNHENCIIVVMKWTNKYRLKMQRIRRKRNGNAETHRYEKTPKGFLMRKYRNMQSRVLGIQWKKAHLYKGLKLLPRKQYYEWAMAHQTFWELFNYWKANNFDRKLCPTVNRINPNKGYELPNMEWITHSENSRQVRHKLKI